MKYKKTTAKQRKLEERNQPLVLLGFGKYDLTQLMENVEKIGIEKILSLSFKYPSRWRRANISTLKEMLAFKHFANLLENNFPSK